MALTDEAAISLQVLLSPKPLMAAEAQDPALDLAEANTAGGSTYDLEEARRYASACTTPRRASRCG